MIGIVSHLPLLALLLLLSMFVGRSANTPLILHKLPITDDPRGARCLDGSPASYFIRTGINQSDGQQTRKWLLHFEGGGWCWNLELCNSRASTRLGSSKEHSVPHERINNYSSSYLSDNSTTNRLFHDWNLVYISYCDASSFAGDSQIPYEGRTLYFNGKAIREAVIEELLEKHAMDKDRDVIVISGESAGALAVFLGIDQMAAQIQQKNPSALVLGLPDSGFFLPFSTRSYEMYEVEHDAVGPHHSDAVIDGVLDFRSGIKNVFTFTRMAAGTHEKCRSYYNRALATAATTIATAGTALSAEELRLLQEGRSLSHAAEADCVFPVNIVRFCRTPLFLLQSRFDSWQLLHEVSNSFSVSEANEYGAMLSEQLYHSVFRKSGAVNGAFVDSCYHHGQPCEEENYWSGDNFRSNFKTGSNFQLTVQEAVEKWISGVSHPSHHSAHDTTYLFEQKHSYPCPQCCPACPSMHKPVSTINL